MWAMIKFFAYSIPLFGYLMDLAKVPMVYPKESEWFQTLDSSDKSVVALEDTDFYKNDLIGLKTLNEAKKV